MSRPRSLLVLVLLSCGVASLVAACGEPTDDPEDCTPNQYFDEAKELCFTCAAIEPPDCAAGCGFRVEPDERGCPSAVCALPSTDPATGVTICGECAANEFFSETTLACERCTGRIVCDHGPARKIITDDRCALRCPDPAPDAT